MDYLGKNFIVIGLIFCFAGFLLFFSGKIPGIGKLPGDIILKKENFTFYFPVATCFIISLLASLIFLLINRK